MKSRSDGGGLTPGSTAPYLVHAIVLYEILSATVPAGQETRPMVRTLIRIAN